MYTGLISVIFTTYNSVKWLNKVLTGFHCQTDRNFEVIVADDGSTIDTRNAINCFSEKTQLPISHVWQKDNGFQKCKIMNKALKVAKGDYVIFTDGDCIPRNDFVSVHRKYAEPGYFLSGGYFKLPLKTSNTICVQDIISGKAFSPEWLLNNGLKKTHKLAKLKATKATAKILNAITPTRRTWNGHNASGWKSDIESVNGFDERMQYGGQDCELGYRLKHKGIKAKQIRYSAICVHLDHPRGYVTKEMLANSRLIKDTTLSQKLTFTEFGLEKEYQ
ncbi:glycosyltransferase family 2 protein [Thalassotalea sediminis]|uniref:glycosyltransferase family 2 protein n=1 Tax=Thalassotalea sediminis TaxID=1759089 RepID=UPI002573F125|nr:glycosyltransferase family 2 protein [Thalassotalea sediminis]